MGVNCRGRRRVYRYTCPVVTPSPSRARGGGSSLGDPPPRFPRGLDQPIPSTCRRVSPPYNRPRPFHPILISFVLPLSSYLSEEYLRGTCEAFAERHPPSAPR